MKYQLEIPNMSCNHCVMKIKKIFEKYSVEVTDVNLSDKFIIIEDKSELKEIDKIKEDLADLDYFVENIRKIE
ncbi:MAG TPA: heavy-metal-associated domain-containing protein [Ignavibacteriales bacterium]|nr:heavy-metal-associated domain-containing protein [Ignavibacteriales bacterium]